MRVQSIKDVEKVFLEPSFEYLVKNGIENTSVRDLCKVMGISYGSLYYWFDGKDDIYMSVVKYGIGKVADSLFKVAFERMSDPKHFFETFADEIDKYKAELRLVIQFATSPEYGTDIRKKAEEFVPIYEKHIIKLAEIIGCTPEKVAPVIYMLISILIDYTVWEDRAATDMQMGFLSEIVENLQK